MLSAFGDGFGRSSGARGRRGGVRLVTLTLTWRDWYGGGIEDTVLSFRVRHGSVQTAAGGSRVEVNCVVMRGFKDDKLGGFIDASGVSFGGRWTYG